MSAARDAGIIGMIDCAINQATTLQYSVNITDAALAVEIAAAISQAKLPDDLPIQAFAHAYIFGKGLGLGQLVLSAVSAFEPSQGFHSSFGPLTKS